MRSNKLALANLGLLTDLEKEATTKGAEPASISHDKNNKEEVNTVDTPNHNSGSSTPESTKNKANAVAPAIMTMAIKESGGSAVNKDHRPEDAHDIDARSGEVQAKDNQYAAQEHKQNTTTFNQFQSLGDLEGDSPKYHSDRADNEDTEKDLGSESDGESHTTMNAGKRKYNKR